MTKALALAILLSMSAPVASQAPGDRQTPNTLRLTPGATPPVATLADMTWLVGRWKGTGLGGVSEGIWADPIGGS